MILYKKGGNVLSIKFESNHNFTIRTIGEQHNDESSMEILNELLKVFEQYVPISPTRKCEVIDNPQHASPLYSNDQISILLQTEGSRYWAQNIYQFAHELCHFTVESGIKDSRYKWFEEVICDVSSHFFLQKLAQEWKESQNVNHRNYANNFLSYSDNALNKNEKFNITELSNPKSKVLEGLSKDQYDRKKNTWVTKKLLPIFIKSPSIWKDISKLAEINKFNNLKEFLIEWRSLCIDENKGVVNKIIHQFGY